MEQNPQNISQPKTAMQIRWPDNINAEINKIKAKLLTFPIKEIVRCLDHKNIIFKCAGIRALGTIKNKEQTTQLIALLDHRSNKLIRLEAINALGNIRDKGAVEPLLKLLNYEPLEIRVASIIALAKIGSTFVIPYFIETLEDRDPRVRIATAEAFVILGDKRGIIHLQGKALDSDETVRKVAKRCINLLKHGQETDPESSRTPISAAPAEKQDTSIHSNETPIKQSSPDAETIPQPKPLTETEADIKPIDEKEAVKALTSQPEALAEIDQTEAEIETEPAPKQEKEESIFGHTYTTEGPGLGGDTVKPTASGGIQDNISKISGFAKLNDVKLDGPLLGKSIAKEMHLEPQNGEIEEQETIEEEILLDNVSPEESTEIIKTPEEETDITEEDISGIVENIIDTLSPVEEEDKELKELFGEDYFEEELYEVKTFQEENEEIESDIPETAKEELYELKTYDTEVSEEDLFEEELEEEDSKEDLTEDESEEDFTEEDLTEDELAEEVTEEDLTEDELEEDFTEEDLTKDELVEEVTEEDLTEDELVEEVTEEDLTEDELVEDFTEEDLTEEELEEEDSEEDHPEEELKEELSEEDLPEEALEEDFTEEELEEELSEEDLPEKELEEELSEEDLPEEQLEEELSEEDITEEELELEASEEDISEGELEEELSGETSPAEHVEDQLKDDELDQAYEQMKTKKKESILEPIGMYVEEIQQVEEEPEAEPSVVGSSDKTIDQTELNYIEMMKSRNLKDRKTAVKELREATSLEALKILVHAANTDISWVRKEAIKSIATNPYPEKIGYLITFLSDSKWYIREEAAKALGTLHAERAFDPISRLLDDENKWVQETALRSLVSIDKEKAIPLIQKLTDSKYINVKTAAQTLINSHQNK